jgi:hypothetical protein
MKSIAASYAPKNNFWTFFPAFKDVDPFRTLHYKDKSPGKRISSMKMWAMALAYDPQSQFYRMPNKFDGIKKAMEKNHRLKLNWDEVSELSKVYYEMFLDQVEKSMMAWEKRMKERDEFLDGIKWTLDYYNEEGRPIKGTADQLDKLHAQTPKHFKEYQTIYKELEALKIKEENKNKSNVKELDV